jgi:molecular chaperone Hsp33
VIVTSDNIMLSENMQKKSSFLPDTVQGFHLGRSDIRGRLVRLGPSVDAIIRRHDYPDPVAALLAESLALTVALAYALKYEGVFTLQTRGDGPVSMMVADITKTGAMRGYASFEPEKVKLAGVGSALLLGKGHLAFTVDQGTNTERYQGIVDLIGRDMAACVQTYFRQSEQLDTDFRVFAGKDAHGAWQSAVLMLQRVPAGGGYAANSNTAEGGKTEEEEEEDWRRTCILAQTLDREEIFDTALDTPRLLHRLFHEEGLETGESHMLADQCRCSRARVAVILSTLSQQELQEAKVDGKVRVTCEFCSSIYEFDDESLQQVLAGPGVSHST